MQDDSINKLFLELGALRAGVEDTKKGVSDLNVKVGIQNGRVGKIEIDSAFNRGMTSILSFTVAALGIPVCLELFKRWLHGGG